MQHSSERPARFPALANRQYVYLLLGNTVAHLAYGMMNVVQGVVAFDITGKNSAVGLASGGLGLSMFLIGAFGGALGDRLSRRRVMLVTHVVVMALFLLTALLIATDKITITTLVLLMLGIGAMLAVVLPTQQAWTGDLLEGPGLASGIALQQLFINACRIVGPLLAGGMIAVAAIGTAGVFVAMAFFFLAAVAMFVLMEGTPPRPGARQATIVGDLAEGARYIWGSGDLRLLMLVFIGVVLSGFSYQTLLPGYLENALGFSSEGAFLGVLFGAVALGGVGTSLVLAGRRGTTDTSRLMLISGLTLAATVAMLAAAPNIGVALVAAVLVGVTTSAFQLLNSVTMFQKADPRFYGRLAAVTMMAHGLRQVVGYPIGAIADETGERFALAGLAVICLAVVLLGMTPGRRRRTRTMVAALPGSTVEPPR